jgi:hypothetical protein
MSAANASEMPGCFRETGAAQATAADVSHECGFNSAYDVPSKQPDTHSGFSHLTTLANVHSLLLLSLNPNWESGVHLKPKEKIHLLNSVLTI